MKRILDVQKHREFEKKTAATELLVSKFFWLINKAMRDYEFTGKQKTTCHRIDTRVQLRNIRRSKDSLGRQYREDSDHSITNKTGTS